MTRMRAALCVAALSALAAGCTSEPTLTMSSGAGATLRADVLALTQAVAHNQWTAADTALAQLRADLNTAAAGGGVSLEQVQVIRADIVTIAADLAAHRATAGPTPSTSSSAKPSKQPTSKPVKPPKPPKKDHGNGHGPGHGHGGED